MILDILLLIIILACLGCFGFGWQTGVIAPASPVGIVLLVVVVLLFLGLIGPHFWTPYPAPPTVR